MAIIVSCVASVYLFHTVIDFMFALGTFMVVLSVVLYSYVPPQPSPASLQSTPLISSSVSSSGALPTNDMVKYDLSASIGNGKGKNDIIIEMKTGGNGGLS